MKSLKKLALTVAMPVLMLGAGTASATSLLLPPANEMTVGVYGDFNIYSLDLLQQCSAALDPRCLPSGPYPIQSATGQIKPELQVYQGSGSGDNYESNTGPLSAPATGDNPFEPSGGSVTSFEMNAGNEPTPDGFTGDRTGTWEIQIGTLVEYLTNPTTDVISSLVFLFGNNQEGNTIGNAQFIWASASLRDGAGAVVGDCFEVFNANRAGCTNPSPLYDPLNGGGDYVPMIGYFCVDKTSGASDFSAARDTEKECTDNNGYWVKNNLGNNIGEFAAYNQALEQLILDNYANNPTWVLSVNVKLANLSDGDEVLWICDRCGFNPDQVPEPATIALLGLSLGLLSFGARRFRKH